MGDPPRTYSTIFTPNPPVESRGLKWTRKVPSSMTPSMYHICYLITPQNASHRVVIASRHHTAVVLRGPHLLLLRPYTLVFFRPHLVLVTSGHLQRRQRAGVLNVRFVVPQFLRRRRGDLKREMKGFRCFLERSLICGRCRKAIFFDSICEMLWKRNPSRSRNSNFTNYSGICRKTSILSPAIRQKL